MIKDENNLKKENPISTILVKHFHIRNEWGSPPYQQQKYNNFYLIQKVIKIMDQLHHPITTR